jgi:hypothetical protein
VQRFPYGLGGRNVGELQLQVDSGASFRLWQMKGPEDDRLDDLLLQTTHV